MTKQKKYNTYFDGRVVIDLNREVSIRDVSWLDMQKIAEDFGVEISRHEGVAWITFGNITIFQGDK